MHIPTADTDTLELLPFRDALEMSGFSPRVPRMYRYSV